jgi:hypothetical protein
MIIQMLVHIKAVPQQMRLMSPTLAQTFKLGLVEVVFQDRHVIRVRALLDDDARALTRRQAAHIGEALLGHDNVEIVLRLVNVCAHGHDARHTSGIGLAGACRGRVHNGVLCGAQEVGGSAEAVQHAASHDAGRVCVSVDVDFDGRVHANDAEATNDLGAVADLLGAEEELGRVLVPVFVETLETIGREADGCRGCEIEVSRVEKVQERVLEDFSPDFEVLEVCTTRLSMLAAIRTYDIW